jgi:hypothetical protein
MLCILLYITVHYLTPPGVTADGGAINTSNAFQESMLKCRKILYKSASGITYKMSLKTCRGPVRLPCRGLRCTRSARTELMFCINVLDHSCWRKLLYADKTQCKHEVAKRQQITLKPSIHQKTLEAHLSSRDLKLNWFWDAKTASKLAVGTQKSKTCSLRAPKWASKWYKINKVSLIYVNQNSLWLRPPNDLPISSNFPRFDNPNGLKMF